MRKLQGGKHLATRVEGAPTPLGVPPCLVDPMWVLSTYPWVLNDRFHIKIGKAGYSSFITSKKTRNRSFLITEHENSMHGRRI